MPPNYRLVSWFIIGTFITWLVFDAWLGPHGGPTESQVLQYWAKRYTAVAWLIGALLGHWCFGTKIAHYTLWPFGFSVLFGLVGWDVNWHHAARAEFYPWFRWPVIWCFVGLLCGMYFWPQRNPDSPF